MRILIACEFTGIERDAFVTRGHEAESCDLLPTERPDWTLENAIYNPRFRNYDGTRVHHPERGKHHQGDVRAYIDAMGASYWDLIIFHWPCTFFTNAGVRWLYRDGRSNGAPLTVANRNEERWRAMKREEERWHWAMRLDCPRMVFENPIPHGYVNLNPFGWPMQTIQPWQFGHGETKATNLYLKGVKPLTPTNIVNGRAPRVHHASPGPERWKERSRALPGIADAMATQFI